MPTTPLYLSLSVLAVAAVWLFVQHRRIAQLKRHATLNEARFRELFHSMVDACAMHEILLDEQGRPCDYLFLAVNPAFERMTGLKATDILGRRVTEVLPGLERRWIDIYGQVAITGQPTQLQEYTATLGRHYEISAYRTAPRQFACAFVDITERKLAEAEMHLGSQRLRLALAAAKAGMWEWDLRTNSNFWSEELWHVYGLSPGSCEPSYAAWRALIHPEDVARVEAIVQQATSTSSSFSAEWRLNGHGDTVRWLLSRGNPQRDDEGRVIRYIGIVIDVSEQKLIGHTLSFLAQCDATPGNEEFFHALARFLATTLGMDFVCIDRLDGDGLTAHTLAVFSDGRFEDNVSYALKDTPCGTVVGQQVCCFPSAVKTLFPNDAVLQTMEAESYAGVTLWNYQGHPIGLIAVIGNRPLTNRQQVESVLKLVAGRAAGELERQRAEETLRDSQDRMQFAMSASHTGAWDLDLTNHTAFRTIEHDRIFGYQELLPEWTYEMFLEHVLPEDRPMVDARFQEAFNQRKDWNFECRIIRRDGEQRWIWACGKHRQQADGHERSLSGIVQDITERKLAEEKRDLYAMQLHQREKMDVIGQLAGGVAHDFNNQLAGILGYADMLITKEQDQKLNRFAQNIKLAAQRAASLTAQLLAFSRKGKFQELPTDMHPLIMEVAELLRRSIDKRIELRLELTASRSTVLGDPTQLQNAILNLGLNARDAMPQGGEIRFATAIISTPIGLPGEDLASGPYLQICVTDTGIGMDEQTQHRLFEPFFTTKGVGKGTGLGLASVYGTVQSHGGTIRVSSDSGRGSTFTLSLPLHEDPPVQRPQEETTSIQTGQGQVLVVDDEQIILELCGDLLRNLGYTVHTFVDPLAALAFYRQGWRHIDLVILDMVMPKMGGRELFLAMRDVNPRMNAIVSSGYSLNSEAQGILDAGASAFVKKPYDQAELSSAVVRALTQHG